MQRFPGGCSLLATAIISTVLASEALGSDPGLLLSRSGSSGSAAPGVLLGRLPLQFTAPYWSAFPLFGGEMTSIVGDPADQAVAWVGSRDAGVFRTTDNGRTWRPSRQGLTFSPIRKLLALPTRPVTLYAGTDFDGVWKSVDGGVSWARAGTTLPGSMVVFNLSVSSTCRGGRFRQWIRGASGL